MLALPPPGPVLVTVAVRAPVAAATSIVMFTVNCVPLFTVVEFSVIPVPLKATVVTPVM